MNKLDIPGFPINMMQVVRQNDRRHSVDISNHDLKRVAFRLSSCGAQHAKACLPVIALGADHQSGTMPGLFVSRSRAQRNPYEVTPVGHIVLRFAFQSMISLPTSPPKSVSPCNRAGLQLFSNSLRLSLAGRSGRKINSPSRTHSLTGVPSAISIWPARAWGMRIAKLFHHFCTVATEHLRLFKLDTLGTHYTLIPVNEC